jgi:hypothetical protein
MSPQLRRRLRPHALALTAALLAAPCIAQAREPGLLTSPFYVSLGTFIVDSDTTLELDGQSGRGDVVDFDRTIGDDDATRFRVDGWWRFADRHKLRALWFDANATLSRAITREIDWGEAEFPVGANVQMDRDFTIYELAYEYSFLKRESLELTGTFGLHYTKFSLGLAANLEVDGQPTETRYTSDTARVEAPLPVVGVRALWNPGGDFWIDASAQFFSLSIDEYDGKVTDYRVAALWQPKTWLGIGLGYNGFALDVDVDKDSFRGSLDWEYGGPQVFLSGSF